LINGIIFIFVFTSDSVLARGYLDNKVYENGNRKTIPTEEGFLEKEGNAWKRYYYLRDHQGITRVVLDESGNAVQSTDYYPFGAYLAERQIAVLREQLKTATGKNKKEIEQAIKNIQ